MYSDDDIQFALESTKIIHEPDRFIDTFGSTSFSFQLVSEFMDDTSQIRIREGHLEANKPAIIAPEHLSDLNFDGFDNTADEFADWMKRNLKDLAFLKYGFQFKRTEVKETIAQDSIETVLDRVVQSIEEKNNPLSVVIHGVDDAWEICLLKFSIEMIQRSHGVNIFDFKRKGLI